MSHQLTFSGTSVLRPIFPEGEFVSPYLAYNNYMHSFLSPGPLDWDRQNDGRLPSDQCSDHCTGEFSFFVNGENFIGLNCKYKGERF